MRSRRDRQDQPILAQNSPSGLGWIPVRRGRVILADSSLPEDMNPLALAAARAEGERNKSQRFPEMIRLDVLGAPAAEEAAPVCRPLKHRHHEGSADQRPLMLRRDSQLIDDPDIAALEVLVG